MKRRNTAAGFRLSMSLCLLSALACSPAGSASEVTEAGTASGGTSGTSGPVAAVAGKSSIDLGGNIAPDAPDGPCRGLECQVPVCAPGSDTTISGKIYDPAGKMPLYNVVVYVPNGPVPALKEGASCDRCGASIVNPATAAVTDETGAFVLRGAPSGQNIPLVIQVGKWRRQIVVPAT